jgi:antitoxin component YwqK of YwqJK toxin-antitoxin module
MDNGFSFATGYSKYTDGAGQGSTLGAWGGYPYFANGMIFHFFEAGSLQNADSYKVQGGYDLTKAGMANTVIKLRYTYFDLDPRYSLSSDGQPQDSMEMIGFQLSYNFMKSGYFNATFERHNVEKENPTDAIRLIGGYRF